MKTHALALFIAAHVTVGFAAELIPTSPASWSCISGAGHSLGPLLSANGRYVAFVSHANNLVTNDSRNDWLDVFVRDLAASNIVLVSVTTSGIGGGNGNSFGPVISSNGQFVAFTSEAANLVTGDTNNATDVLVRDLSSGTTRLVSSDSLGHVPPDPNPNSIIPLSSNPLISPDGEWVFFESRATNLTSVPDTNGTVDVFARSLRTNLTFLVSVDQTGSRAANGSSMLAAVSGNARYVAFTSTATNIAPGGTNATGDLYVRDMIGGSIVCVSSNVRGLLPDGCRWAQATLDADGRHIAFATSGPNNAMLSGVSNVVFHHDLQSGVTTLVALRRIKAEGRLQISENGQFVAFDDGTNVFRFNAAAGTNELVSVTTTGIALTNRVARNAAMTPDGSHVIFVSNSPDLITNGSTTFQIYARDMSAGTTRLITMTTSGQPSATSHETSVITMSDDSSRIAFESVASDLVNDDSNGASDIFLSAGVTELISQAQRTPLVVTAFSHSFLGPNSVSADGRFIASLRYDDPSAFRDTNGWHDVFVSDVANGRSVAVSVSSNTYVTNFNDGSPPTVTFIDNTNAFQNAVISSDGGTVAAVRRYARTSSSIVPPSSIALARASNGVFSSSGMRIIGSFGDEDSPTLSGDGALLAYRSGPDIFVHYSPVLSNGVFQGTNNRVSVGFDGSMAGGLAPAISPDGAWVAFASAARNLVPPLQGQISGAYYQCFVAFVGTNRLDTNFLQTVPKHLGTYTTSTQAVRVLTLNPPSTNTHWNTVRSGLSVHASNSFFSADSRYVFFALADGSGVLRQELMTFHTNVFRSGSVMTSNGFELVYSTNLFPGAVTTLACTNCANASASADGNIVAFERRRLPGNVIDLFATDLLVGTEELVSINVTGSARAGDSSTSPRVSRDGRYVVFQSKANDLVASDANGTTDVFVRDRLLGVTMLVSANARGFSGNGPSSAPVMAAGGNTVVFHSMASDLVEGDYNDKRDIFVLRLGGADTDADGLDDDWEVAYFSNLSRDGSGDFDEDGVGDREEFLAGTDPTNSHSVFRVLTVTALGGGGTRVIWNAAPGRAYRVEYKDDLSAAAWTPLSGTISWSDSTASITDSSPGTNRFYRAVRLP